METIVQCEIEWIIQNDMTSKWLSRDWNAGSLAPKSKFLTTELWYLSVNINNIILGS